MKKILTVFLSVLMLVGTFTFPVSYADDVVTFSLDPSDLASGYTTFTVDVIAHIPEGADVVAVGMLVTVPEGLSLESFKKVYTDEGMYTCSASLEENPYMILWVSGTASLPAGDTVMCTLTFKADTPLDSGVSYNIGFCAEPDNLPQDRNGNEVYAEYSGCEILVEEVIEPVLKFELVEYPLHEGDTTLAVDLMVTLPEFATGYELGYFCLEVRYNRRQMELSAPPQWNVIGGDCENSNDLTDYPYILTWISIDKEDQFSSGRNLIATLTFELAQPATSGEIFEIGLAADPLNFVASMESKDGRYKEEKYSPEEVIINGTSFGISVNYGDANGDQSITLLDTSLMLKYIARWDTIQIDTVAADVNLDGNVTLADVSRILKYIAKWNGIVLGTE
ncbi:MAG: hypothetical protein E7578_02735 [Ruminococcaceae bacterium]|nr:hypothetical protein [Oscillospiraceae bacterium]